MSHRITTETEMKDPDIVRDICDKAGYSFTRTGDVITFTTGPLARATLDLTSGVITGDSDHHRGSLGSLRQAYAETKYIREITRQGGRVDNREVVDGKIVLYCSVG